MSLEFDTFCDTCHENILHVSKNVIERLSFICVMNEVLTVYFVRSSVKVKKFLSANEVQEIVSQIKTYNGTPVEPKPAMTEEQKLKEARTELARKGSLLMVDLMKEKYPECEIEYDEESER